MCSQLARNQLLLRNRCLRKESLCAEDFNGYMKLRIRNFPRVFQTSIIKWTWNVLRLIYTIEPYSKLTFRVVRLRSSRAAVLRLLDASLFRRAWITWMAGYQDFAKLDACWRGNPTIWFGCAGVGMGLGAAGRRLSRTGLTPLLYGAGFKKYVFKFLEHV